MEASTADGSMVSADVLDVPDEIDPNLNAFALVFDPHVPVVLNGYDASGRIVATGSIGHVQAPLAGAPLEDGRHFGYVRSVDPNTGTIEFDLAYFLSGKDANDAYQAAGGTGPVPILAESRDRSSGATITWGASLPSSRTSQRSPCAGSMVRSPALAMRCCWRAPSRLAMPSPAHGPHPMLTAGSPAPWRWWARPSRKALAAA